MTSPNPTQQASVANLVKNVRSVGGPQHDDAFLRPNAVHLHQQLVQCVLLLQVGPKRPEQRHTPFQKQSIMPPRKVN